MNRSKESNTTDNNIHGQDDFAETFPAYAFEVVSDIILGIVLGISVNMFVNYVGKILHLPVQIKLLFQLFIIIAVLYIMKIDSKYLYSSWKGQTSYGIIFTTVFFAVQKNMVQLFEVLYNYE
jgi:uncharacterized membrane protein YvlD (DUF360 family)